MAEHGATIAWERGGAVFVDGRYGRGHVWRFDGGEVVRASSSPHVVPVPMSDPAGVDPEEAFVASLSSCHMLWFLSIAAGSGWVVERYVDSAAGKMGRDVGGRMVMLEVVLRPRVEFGGGRKPERAEVEALHHRAHEACFLANSVRCVVRVEVEE